VDVLPKVQAATRRCAESIRDQIKDVLRKQLSTLKIVPEGIPKLKDYIVMMHNNSVIPSGEPVGMRCAEAIGQPLTQMTLNSFHSAGSSANVGMGLSAASELYNVSVKRKNENIKLHFKNKDLTFEDIIELRRKIVGVNVEDLILEKEYFDFSEDLFRENYWNEVYVNLYNKKIPKCKVFIRITFDKVKLYSYNLTLQDICNKIEDMQITCIPSPTCEGYIDFYPDDNYNIETLTRKNEDISINEENVSIIFLRLTFVPTLKDIQVSGITGITQIFPYGFNVNALIQNTESLPEMGENVWKLHINTVKQYLDGIPMYKLDNLLEICKFKIYQKSN
jgi:hypothetical protein